MRFDFYTSNEISDILGQRLKQHRLSQNLTQAQLAERAGVGLSTVRRVELGKGGSLDNIIRITIALGRVNEFAELFATTPKTVDEVLSKYQLRQRASGKPQKGKS